MGLSVAQAIRDYFVAEGVVADVDVGSRKRGLNTTSAKGARVVVQFGTDDGKVGKLGPPKQTSSSRRQLMTLDTVYQIAIWAIDKSAEPSDEEAHIAKVLDLFEKVGQAIHLSFCGRYAWSTDVRWTVVREVAHGYEMLTSVSVQMPFSDKERTTSRTPSPQISTTVKPSP